MAAYYSTSTQKQNWLFDDEEIEELREAVEKQHSKLVEQYPLPDRRFIFIFCRDRLIQLGKNLRTRQQCVATALVYLQRYFLYNAIQDTNLYLLIATAFYLSSKTEEAPHHIRLVASEARQIWTDYVPSDPARIGEMEFCLISELQSQLIIWHPYRTLTALRENKQLALSNDEMVLAWSIVNDSYMTDLPLTCAPHLIAMMAMFLAVIFAPGQFASRNSENESRTTEATSFPSMVNQPSVMNSFGYILPSGSMPAPAPVARPTIIPDKVSVRNKTLFAVQNSERMQNILRFLVESQIDLERLIDITQEIISLYELWEQYDDKNIREGLSKYIKGQGLEM